MHPSSAPMHACMQIILNPPPPPVESLLSDLNDPKAKGRQDAQAAAAKGKGGPNVHIAIVIYYIFKTRCLTLAHWGQP